MLNLDSDNKIIEKLKFVVLVVFFELFDLWYIMYSMLVEMIKVNSFYIEVKLF